MQLGRAFTYIFDDRDWIGKLAIVMILSFSSIVLLPVVLIGLLPLCILLGYMVEIVENVRQDRKVLLPAWDNYQYKLSRGGNVLLALIVYHLPLTVCGCCVIFFPGLFGDFASRGLVAVMTLCCIFPLALVWFTFGWIFMATGTVLYARGEPVTIYFQPGKLWGAVQRADAFSAAWMLMAILANIVLAVIGITIIGAVVTLALFIPVQAHLLGQYARRINPRGLKRG